MSEETKKAPAIRFQGFTDDWEQRKFEEMLDKNDGVRRGPFGSALKKEIFVKNSDYVVYEQQNAIYDNYKTRYNITKEKFDELHKFSLKENDFIMSGAGTIGRISRVPKGIKKGVFNQALIRFRINNELTNPEYFLQFVRAENMQRKLTGANPGSAISNLVPMSEVKKWEVFVPIKAEQKKLGSFFEQLDDTIALHQRKVTLLKRLKEAYLTRMLPQNSENIPLLRFADYFDPWEQRKFEDLAESFNYGLNASAMEFDGENKYIRITDIDEYSHRFIQSGLTSPNTDLSNANDYLLKEGDILFARTGASVGKSYQYDPLDGKVYYAGFLIRARIKPEFDSSFIFQNTLTEKYNNFIKITSQRSGQPGVNAQEYANFSIMVPSRGEQVKLGNFFKQLDNAIALHQCKIEKLAKAKKVLLAAMFV